MAEPKIILRSTDAIPELGVVPGDAIVIRPGHPLNPVVVARGFARESALTLLPHLSALTFVSARGGPERPESVRAWLLATSPLEIVR